jgi:hypothetical protein
VVGHLGSKKKEGNAKGLGKSKGHSEAEYDKPDVP